MGSDGQEITINYKDEAEPAGRSRFSGTESLELLLAEYNVPVGTVEINYEQPSSWAGVTRWRSVRLLISNNV